MSAARFVNEENRADTQEDDRRNHVKPKKFGQVKEMGVIRFAAQLRSGDRGKGLSEGGQSGSQADGETGDDGQIDLGMPVQRQHGDEFDQEQSRNDRRDHA